MSSSARRSYVDTTFGQIHVTEQGAGPAVLLMHWVPLSGRMYEAELPYFAKAGRRAIAVDLMGFGRSDRREGVWSVEQHADCIITRKGSRRCRQWTARRWFASQFSLGSSGFAEKIAAVTAPTLVLTSETEPLRASFEPITAARGACATHEFPGDHPLHESKRAGEFAHVVTQLLDLVCHP